MIVACRQFLSLLWVRGFHSHDNTTSSSKAMSCKDKSFMQGSRANHLLLSKCRHVKVFTPTRDSKLDAMLCYRLCIFGEYARWYCLLSKYFNHICTFIGPWVHSLATTLCESTFNWLCRCKFCTYICKI